MILESIYEPTFPPDSHGFRPKRSCHTALRHIDINFKGAVWFVEGDIKACFDSFDHHVLANALRRRIDDEYFIALLWKFLKAGYMEQWKYRKTFSGTPQGSGINPILANITSTRWIAIWPGTSCLSIWVMPRIERSALSTHGPAGAIMI